jgi:hypothetical protein
MMIMNSLDPPSARVIGGGEYEDDDTVELELNEAAIQALTAAASLAQAASEERPEPGLTPGASVQGTAAAEEEPELLEHSATAAGPASEGSYQAAPAPSQQGVASIVHAPRERRQFALGLGMVAAAAGLLGGVAYLATARARHPDPVPIVANSGSRPTTVPTVRPSASTSELSELSETPDDPVQIKNPFDRSEVFEFPAGITAIQARDAVAELLLQRALERKNLSVKKPRRNAKTDDQSAASVTASRATPRS